ncbi:aquaporin [bacterium]|nr:aquaporin [bacterium]|tara:strand:+ start:324 stop:956 length:633 start_codon:yes stop_codon:yes gene_type:complete
MNIKKEWISEYIGVFALTFIGTAAMAGGGNLLTVAFAHGLTIAVMVSALAKTSGAHFNPAVTIALWSIDKFESKNMLGYIVSQVLGGAVGALLALWIWGSGQGIPAFNGVSNLQGMLIEVTLTFFLVFVITSTVINKMPAKNAALYIGLTVCIGILAGGPFTGAAMNPARHLGSYLVSGGSDIQVILIYWVAPLIGGIKAAKIWKGWLSN